MKMPLSMSWLDGSPCILASSEVLEWDQECQLGLVALNRWSIH